MPSTDICFLATSKSGLGHLRRCATIAKALRSLDPKRRLHLISNAPAEGMEDHQIRTFDTAQVLEKDRMAAAAVAAGAGVLVLDTMTAPGIERTGLPLALVLRETPDDQLYRFRLGGGKPWDLVVIANPETHWMPPAGALAARSVVPAGWIYRSTGARRAAGAAVPTVLVATGGGGTAETAGELYPRIDAVLWLARKRGQVFDVVQAIGPRAQGFGQLAQADRRLDPGPALNDHFRDADIVISTAGYNSVLELATTDTPTLLVPIPRSIDDQTTRARSWAGSLGAWLDPAAPDAAARWLIDAIIARQRRPPAALGPSGEDTAARAILALA